MTNALLITADHLLAGFTVGTTVWFFFVQSPFLAKLLGKEKFVNVMMPLTRLWVKTMFVSSTALLTIAAYNHFKHEVDLKFYIVAVGWLAIAINCFVIVPKALQAGARSQKDRRGDNSKNLQEFGVDGGGGVVTKTLHQTVVVFVLIMVGSFVVHSVDLAGATMMMSS
jgi:hypothetical protein